MAYDDQLAGRVRRVLKDRWTGSVQERAMFGGLTFMVRGRMCCGIVGDRLMVRVDPDAYDELLAARGATPMDFTGRPMRGFLYVGRAGMDRPAALRRWIDRALAFVARQPPKPATRAGQPPSSRRKAASSPSTSGRRAPRRRGA